MTNKPLIVVVGADGFVGGGFAEGLQAERVVYGPPQNGDIPISHAEGLIRRADVIINAGGFRVRRGLSYADYQRCHQGATSVLVPWVRKGALFIHMSSAHVLGKSRHTKPGNQTPPNPETYPCSAYAVAKWEADQFMQKEAADREFRLVFLRPTILYARQGDCSLVDNLIKVAKAGRMLRLYPRDARHHLCHLSLLVEVARRVIKQNPLPQASSLVVADPFTVSSRELEGMIRRHLRQKAVTVPVPAPWIGKLLRLSFRSRNPKLDFRTWGEIFGVLHLDTEYDPSETYRMLQIDPLQYSQSKTLLPFIEQSLQ
jgi:nucleoside-diphosphate-sugar epimerase